jgi:hypothetical protein
MTNGAPHVYPNLAKGQLQREYREKLTHAAMATAARPRCGSPLFDLYGSNQAMTSSPKLL